MSLGASSARPEKLWSSRLAELGPFLFPRTATSDEVGFVLSTAELRVIVRRVRSGITCGVRAVSVSKTHGGRSLVDVWLMYELGTWVRQPCEVARKGTSAWPVGSKLIRRATRRRPRRT